MTGFTMLLALPTDHGAEAEAVQAAMVAARSQLPETLKADADLGPRR